MANQNFRVKKGLEVGLGATFLYADDTGVGINSTAPRYNLDVNGIANVEDGLIVGGASTIVAGSSSTVFPLPEMRLLGASIVQSPMMRLRDFKPFNPLNY